MEKVGNKMNYRAGNKVGDKLGNKAGDKVRDRAGDTVECSERIHARNPTASFRWELEGNLFSWKHLNVWKCQLEVGKTTHTSPIWNHILSQLRQVSISLMKCTYKYA